MMRSKKGVEWGAATVMTLIIMGLAAVALSFIVPVVTNIIKGQGGSAACAVALYGEKGVGDNCPIEDAEIFDNRLKIRDKVVLEKRSEDEDFPKEALTRLLRNCLGRGGGVNSRAFTRDEWFGQSEVCLECYRLTIDADAGEKIYVDVGGIIEEKFGIKGFTGYLSGNGPKGSSDEKYIDILTKNEIHKEAYMEYGRGRDLSPSKGTFTFTSGEDYTVFFVGLKKGSADNIFGRAWKGVKGDVLGAVLGTSDTYFAYISESGNLKNACERKVN